MERERETKKIQRETIEQRVKKNFRNWERLFIDTQEDLKYQKRKLMKQYIDIKSFNWERKIFLRKIRTENKENSIDKEIEKLVRE